MPKVLALRSNSDSFLFVLIGSMALGKDIQLTTKPPYPAFDFSGKTIIVTGANIGLGKEVVQHFVRLKAERIIMAVRSIAKGEAAKADIEAETKRVGVCGIWELDQSTTPQ